MHKPRFLFKVKMELGEPVEDLEVRFRWPFNLALIGSTNTGGRSVGWLVNRLSS